MMLSAVCLAGCVHQAGGSVCDGWRPNKMKSETVLYLVANDPGAANDILTNNEYGESRGCWSAPK